MSENEPVTSLEYIDADIPCSNYVAALLYQLFYECNRVISNNTHICGELGGYHDENMNAAFVTVLGPEMTYQSYYWIEPSEKEYDQSVEYAPNFSFNGVCFRWYKHARRGLCINLDLTPTEWIAWFDEALWHIRSRDRQLESSTAQPPRPPDWRSVLRSEKGTSDDTN